MLLAETIRTIPDYPKKGILFRDITTLLGDAKAFRRAVDELVQPWAGRKIDKVAGVEARGFILGGAVAHQLSAGFVPIRKKGKLPHATVSIPYSLEYGLDHMEMHEDAVTKGERVILVDDLIATGGTAEGAVKLLRQMGAEVIAACFVIDLPDLGGAAKLEALACRCAAWSPFPATRASDPSSAFFPRLRHRPPMGVEQGGAKVERIARGFADQRERGRPARRQAAGQQILLESEMRLELLRQVLHADVFGQADDLDRLDAMVGGGAQDALEQLLADAAASIALLDRERRLGVDMAPEWRLLAPDRLIGAQFGRADHFAVDKRAVEKIALAEAIFGVMDKEVVRHAAAETQMPAARVKAKQMIAKRFLVGRTKAAGFRPGMIWLRP